MIKPFRHSQVCFELKNLCGHLYCHAFLNGLERTLGAIKQNQYGFFTSGDGRYYSNPTPAAYDMVWRFIKRTHRGPKGGEE